MLLPDDEVVTHINTLVEAWKQREVVEREIQEFESRARTTTASSPTFDSIEAFMAFNQGRREYWQEREDLHQQRDNISNRFEESRGVVQVLLPKGLTLIHVHMGSRYVIRNGNNGLQVSVSGSA